MRDKGRKKIHYAFGISKMDREIALLNKYSAEGWHFERSCFIGAVLKKDDSVVYRYQIDYHPKADQRYYDTFRELGWEHVAANALGYHYFRKVYDHSRSTSEYEIYNDNESYSQSIKTQTALTSALALISGMYAISSGWKLFANDGGASIFVFILMSLCFIVFTIATIVFTIATVSLRRRMNDRNSKSKISGREMIWITLPVIIGELVLVVLRVFEVIVQR